MHSRVKAACSAARFLQWEGVLRFTAARRGAAAGTALCAAVGFAAFGAWRGFVRPIATAHANPARLAGDRQGV